MRFTEFITESSKICPQCGMRGCTCKPGTCKCKPKPGYPKQVDEAANPAQQAAIAISMKKAGKKPKSVDEADMNRRGFLKGLGAAAIAGAGLGAMGSAQAGGATAEYMQVYSKAKSKFEAGYDIGQVARALGVSGPNNNMVGPMGGEWGAINKAAQEMGVRNQDAPVAPPTQSRPSAEKQNPVTAEYQRLSIMALRFSLTNPKFEQEYAPIEARRNHTMDTLINGTSGRLSANPAIAQRQRIAIAQYMDDANSEYIQKTSALLKQYGALKEQSVAEEGKGLWANIHAKQNRIKKGSGEHMRKPGSKGAPTAKNFKDAASEGIDEDWQKVNKKDKTDGMSKKAVSAYRRENPGSKLKTAVTTKPSKLKKGSKSAKRRKSFCARMSGMKKAHASAKTKRDPDSPINKALRRWNCESVQQMEKLVMIAEQKIRDLKK